MRYAIVDLEGAPRDHFGDRQELVDELRDVFGEDPEALNELFVVTYDHDGYRVGAAERADEVLEAYSGSRMLAVNRVPVLAWIVFIVLVVILLKVLDVAV